MEKIDNRHRLTAAHTLTVPSVKPKVHHDTTDDRPRPGRKSRTKKKIKKHSSQTLQNKDWLTEQADEFQPGSCWMPQGQQRLFTAISDPAVCGYPMSLGCPIEQFSLPMIPVYASPVPQKVSYKPSVPVIRKQYRARNHVKEPQGTDEYASLPPVNLPDFESDHQRRFSDPGLANGPVSDEESDSGDDQSGSVSSIESQFADRLSQVVKNNKRLETELQDTKSELQELRLEINELKQSRSSYEPGLVSDLVREVREAMKLHQQAFISRVHSSHTTNVADKISTKNCEELKKKIQDVTKDRDSLLERLKRLEEQVKTVMVHNCVQKSNQEELVMLENEKMQLRRELQEAVEGRKVAEEKVQNFEQLMKIIQKKVPNGLALEEKSMNGERSPDRLGGVSSVALENGSGGGSNSSVVVGGGGGPPSSGRKWSRLIRLLKQKRHKGSKE